MLEQKERALEGLYKRVRCGEEDDGTTIEVLSSG
jgi:hypothetical protein